METGSGTAQSGAARADHERPRVKVRHCPAPVLPRPWPVEVVVEPAEHHRGVAHRIQVRLLVKPAKEFRRVVKGVDVTDVAHAELGERTLERLGGPHVAGAGGRREYQDARPTSITVRAWARTDPIRTTSLALHGRSVALTDPGNETIRAVIVAPTYRLTRSHAKALVSARSHRGRSRTTP